MARNKRNLTWLSAHFLNGMFPLPLTDIMYLLWITTGKIALVSISFSSPFLPLILSLLSFSAPPPFVRKTLWRGVAGFSCDPPAAAMPRSPIDTADTLCRSRVVSSTVSFTRFPHGNPFQSSSPFVRLRFP